MKKDESAVLIKCRSITEFLLNKPNFKIYQKKSNNISSSALNGSYRKAIIKKIKENRKQQQQQQNDVFLYTVKDNNLQYIA